MWSRYLRTKEREGVVAIFHELHPDPIYCSLEKWNEIVQGLANDHESLVATLKSKNLIVSSHCDDDRDFEKVESELMVKLNNPSILYLMTAQGCNFNCKYCPVPGIAKRHGESLLSVNDAIAGINLWRSHLDDTHDPDSSYFVIFYGGEPLLNKDTISASLSYLDREIRKGSLPSNINFMIATNGSLIDKKTIEMFKKYDVMVAVGLDGPKELNDSLRVDCDGEGTFDRITASIEELTRSGIRTFVSTSITPDNIDHIMEYSSFLKDFGIEKFGFNFLKGEMLMNMVGRDGIEGYYQKSSLGVIANYRQHDQAGFEYQMEKKQEAFDGGIFYPVDCTCYGNQLVIQPDGQISNCPFYKAKLGHIQSVNPAFRIWDQDIVREWRKRLPIYHEGEAKALSGGGCAWSSIELKGDYVTMDDSSTIFSEEVLNEFIWSKYDNQLKSQNS